jgi:hypothetical protein
VSNVGFGVDATHTTCVAEPTVADQGLGVLRHPRFVLRDAAADRFTFQSVFAEPVISQKASIPASLKRRIKAIRAMASRYF